MPIQNTERTYSSLLSSGLLNAGVLSLASVAFSPLGGCDRSSAQPKVHAPNTNSLLTNSGAIHAAFNLLEVGYTAQEASEIIFKGTKPESDWTIRLASEALSYNVGDNLKYNELGKILITKWAEASLDTQTEKDPAKLAQIIINSNGGDQTSRKLLDLGSALVIGTEPESLYFKVGGEILIAHNYATITERKPLLPPNHDISGLAIAASLTQDRK